MKKFLSAILIITLLVTIIVNNKVFNKNSIIENKPFKMYLDNGNGEYELSNSKKFPTIGFVLNTEKTKCDNGSKISQNEDKSIKTSLTSGDACTLYFDRDTAVNTILDMAGKSSDTCSTDEIGDTGLAYDCTTDNNLRYVGANPNNYVTFNDEDAGWRIIGVMNNIDDGTGKKESRIKLIRATRIGIYSWNTTNSETGLNAWSKADLMKLLNPGYENESIGGSLYWNKKSGQCYDDNNTYKSCDFTSTGLNANAKNMIDNVVWNISPVEDGDYQNIGTPPKFYELERSNGTDTSELSTTLWTGRVALMYPSDYGYATNRGEKTSRTTCLGTNLDIWSEHEDCYINDWLRPAIIDWTLTAHADMDNNSVYRIYGSIGYLGHNGATDNHDEVRPALYLKPSVKIVGGIGTKSEPYRLEI